MKPTCLMNILKVNTGLPMLTEKQCEKLKDAGYPQRQKGMYWFVSPADYKGFPNPYYDECTESPDCVDGIAIPTIGPFMKWLAEKYGQQGLELSYSCSECGYNVFSWNIVGLCSNWHPDPMQALYNLFEKLEDEDE